MPLKQGDQAPDVTLPSHEGKQVSLRELWSKQPLVVHFFPLAFTSTCTEQVCTAGNDLPTHRELDALPVAISVDSPYVLARFRAECGVDYPFLSDFNREAVNAFGVLRTDPVGPGLRNAADRAVFVIDRDGRVAYAWHSTNPGLLPPFDEIRAALARLRVGSGSA
ncbi:MAG TPA: peroxiredoxin [Longimicrobiaceae bacterium]|nr:peroxiredoxin [Longimicrobiaceae bacterium]